MEDPMRRISLLVLPLLLASPSAFAASASGSSGLALAALAAEHSPLLNGQQKSVMARLLDGRLASACAPNRKISVTADSVVCRAGNVDITAHSCQLGFGVRKITITGRKAHELYATLVEVGVPSDGAAGTIFESLSHLACTIDPNEVKQKSGGGADCTFDPGAP
jgi:hypothetical protein